MKKTKTLFARYLTLLVLALLSTNFAWGETVTYQHVFNAKPDTGNDITLSGVQWNISATNLNGYNSGNYAGVQFGTKNADGQITLTSPNAWSYTKNSKEYTVINEVRLWLNLGGTSVTPKVTIGGKEATKNGTVTKNSSAGSDWTKASKVTFTPVEGGTSGIVVIDVTSVKAGYICALEIDCEEAVTKTLESITVKNAPTKVTYNVGETFAPAGLVITATYDTGDEDIAYAGKESDFTFSPDLNTALTTANNKVTISYGGKSCDQNITVNLNKLATPTNLQATPTSTSATLTWDEVANASSYEVKLDDGEAKITTTNSLLVEDLIANTKYVWSVKAIGDKTTYDESDESLRNEFTTLAPPIFAYTVTFSGNNQGTPASESITETEPAAGVTLPNCTPNAGYQFVGWATSETATEAEYEAGDTYYPTANITLYAVYNQVFTITWSVNGTSTTEGNPTTSVVKGDGITALPTAPASISGMAFQGWTAAQIATSSTTAPTDLFKDVEHAPAIDANTTFYAVFAEKNEGDVTWKIANDIAANDVIIIATNKNYTNTMKTAGTISNSLMSCMASTFNSDKTQITSVANGTLEFTLGGNSTSGWTLQNGTNYLGMSGDKKVALSSTSSTWAINITDGVATVSQKYVDNNTEKNYSLQYNYNNGNDRFTGYTSSQVAISLYKKTQDITYTNYCTTVVTKTLESISLSGEYPTEFWKDETFSHEGVIVTAHYNDESTKDVTSSATFSTPDMTTTGEQTVTVTYEGKTATYNITVKTIANTQETAYTTAEAKVLIDAGKDLETKVYVKGTVSEVDSYNNQYKSITYWLDNDAFEVYSGKNLNNTDFASKDDVKVGDDVVVYGIIKKFNSTYEFDKNNYLVSHVKATTLEIKNITVELDGEISPEITTTVPEAGRTITYSVASEDVVKVDEEGKLVTVAVGGPVTVTATLTAEGYKDATTTFTVEVIKALTSIEVKTAPTNTSYKAGDKFDPTGLVITANYNDETTEDIAYSDETKDSFTFEPSLETALTTDNNSVTITYAGKEATQTITVRALYTYDIAWMANGVKHATTQVTEGDALALPETSPEAIGDFVFKGWINTENYYNAETAPEYIVPETITPTGAMTFYAVFAKATVKEGQTSLTINDNTQNFPTKYGNANTFDECTLEGYKFAIQQAYINGTKLQWRAAGNSSGTGTMYNKDALNKIQSIQIKYAEGDSNKNFTVSVGSATNPTEGTSISPAVSEIYNYTFDCSAIEPDYFVLTNGSGAGYLSEIVIKYIGLVSKTTDYTTSITDASMSITAAKWGTFCVPFDVELEEGVKAYTADASGSEVEFTEVNGTIEAGTPVVVYKDVTETYTKDYSAAVEDFSETCTSGVLVGVYAATSDITAETGYTNYVLQNNDQGVGFYKVGETSTISLKANRCYMTLPASADAKPYFALEDVITGINNILYPTDKSVEGIFDLSGRKLAAPQKGINIINGVKVIVK